MDIAYLFEHLMNAEGDYLIYFENLIFDWFTSATETYCACNLIKGHFQDFLFLYHNGLSIIKESLKHLKQIIGDRESRKEYIEKLLVFTAPYMMQPLVRHRYPSLLFLLGTLITISISAGKLKLHTNTLNQSFIRL